MTCIGAYCYTTMHEARGMAKYLSFVSHKPHHAIKSKILAVDPKDEIPCYTVMMS